MRVLPADYIVMVFYMVIVIALGVYVSNQGGNFENILLAGRKVGLYGLAASFIATEWGPVGMYFKMDAGSPFMLSQLYPAWAIFGAFLVVGFLGLSTVLPRRTKIMTAGEILGLRYGKAARVIFGILMTVSYILLLGMLLNVSSAMFAVFLGTSPGFMMILMVLVTAIYTVSGGMWSIVLTNYIHVAVIGIMVPVSALFSVRAAGGFEHLFAELSDAAAKAAPAADSFALDTGFGSVFVKFLLFLCIALCFPTVYSRTFSAKSASTAYKGFIVGAVALLGCAVFSIVIAAASTVVSPNAAGATAFARTIVASTPNGLIGLMCASAMGVFMSACSSYYLAVGRMFSKDIMEQVLPGYKKLDDSASIHLLRTGIVLSAVFSLLIGFNARSLGAVFEAAAVVAASGGAACILFGLYWRRAGALGAIGSFASGGLYYIVSAFGFHSGYNLTYFGTILASFLAMILFSLMPRRRKTGKKSAKSSDLRTSK